MSVYRGALALVICLLAFSATALGAAPPKKTPTDAVQCGLPESNAEALVILNNYYPGYWWDHTDLTIAVQAHPSAADEQLDGDSGRDCDVVEHPRRMFRRTHHAHRRNGEQAAGGRHRRALRPHRRGCRLRWLRALWRPRMPEHPGSVRPASEPRPRALRPRVPGLGHAARDRPRPGTWSRNEPPSRAPTSWVRLARPG